MRNPKLSTTVLVTAAGQGIGAAIARRFAQDGSRVIATDIDPAKLEEASKGLKIDRRKLDVRNDEEIKLVCKAAGVVDVLINCAGIVHQGTAIDAREKELDLAFDVNVKSMWRMAGAIIPGMLERRNGAIINISSVVGSIKGAPGRFVYGVTKAAVVGLTKSIAADYVAYGIRCNAICPGTVDTPSLNERIAASGDAAAAHAAFVSRQPMGRLGSAEEIADLAAYLATATFTTGQAYVVDGGWSN